MRVAQENNSSRYLCTEFSYLATSNKIKSDLNQLAKEAKQLLTK